MAMKKYIKPMTTTLNLINEPLMLRMSDEMGDGNQLSREYEFEEENEESNMEFYWE